MAATTMDLATAQQQGIVIGLKGQSGTQPRREIDDLMVNDPDCFNLYILALEALTRDGGNASDKMGYFQIAGIHGLPLSDWDGIHVPARKDSRGRTVDTVGSYCTHASFLFPSWHRPYLAMMEQTLYSAVQSIAAKFQDPKYQAAAKRFRLPYWDWIKPRAHQQTLFPGVRDPNRMTSFAYNYDLPLVCQVPELNVFQPGSEQTLSAIRNPLRWYDFPKNGSVPKSGWDQLDARDTQLRNPVHPNRTRTVREPATTSSLDDYKSVNNTLNMVRQATVIQALDLMSTPYDKYLDFAAESPRWVLDSNKQVMRDNRGNPLVNGPHGSLEDIHNGYHVYVGGNGHMGRVPVAAFDPVFWLHHCNIDRLLSVWQACHSGPSSWLPSDNPIYGQDVPLWPFRAGSGANNMWTSAMAKTTTVFGYTYTDIQSSPADTLGMWNENYAWSDPRNSRPARLPQPPARMAPVDVTKAQVFQSAAVTSSPILMTFALPQKAHEMQEPIMAASAVAHPDEKVPQVMKLLESASKPDAEAVVQWYVDVQVQRDAFNGAFTIFFFIGSAELMREADQHPERYSTAPMMAGLTHVFTAPREACDACNVASEQGVVVTGTNPVTPMLRDYVFNGTIAGLADEQVVPFLKKSLYWRVVATNNIPKDTASVPGLKVTVSSTVAVQQPGEGVPAVWEPHEHPEITDGRSSGNPVGASL